MQESNLSLFQFDNHINHFGSNVVIKTDLSREDKVIIFFFREPKSKYAIMAGQFVVCILKREYELII